MNIYDEEIRVGYYNLDNGEISFNSHSLITIKEALALIDTASAWDDWCLWEKKDPDDYGFRAMDLLTSVADFLDPTETLLKDAESFDDVMDGIVSLIENSEEDVNEEKRQTTKSIHYAVDDIHQRYYSSFLSWISGFLVARRFMRLFL